MPSLSPDGYKRANTAAGKLVAVRRNYFFTTLEYMFGLSIFTASAHFSITASSSSQCTLENRIWQKYCHSIFLVRSSITSFDKNLLAKQREYDNAKKVAADTEHVLQPHYARDLDRHAKEISRLTKDLAKAKRDKEKLKYAIPTYEKYLELFDNIAILLKKTTSIELMNKILSKFFSNFYLEAEMVPPKMINSRWRVVASPLKTPTRGMSIPIISFMVERNISFSNSLSISLKILMVL